MSVPLIHETDAEELDLPGRHLRWVVAADRIPAEHCSACVIRVAPGEKVRPAHSHPNGEEVIYIIRGSGRVLVWQGKWLLFARGRRYSSHRARYTCCTTPVRKR